MARLDEELVKRGLVLSRSQAHSLIKLGKVKVNGQVVTSSHKTINKDFEVAVEGKQYVSRGGLKLASVAQRFNLDFKHKVILDVGSSTGGFTDYSLQASAKKVIAVDVGTNQLHPKLQNNSKIELHEKTDIRNFRTDQPIDIVLIDVSFISLRQILPVIAGIAPKASIVAMVKPQFESQERQKNKGVVKNNKLRRQILNDFEAWAKDKFLIKAKADSEVAGAKGNLERFYLLLAKR